MQDSELKLARANLDRGDCAAARSILEGLRRAEPTSIALRTLLAETCFRSGDYGGCRELIVAMQANGVDTPLGRVALALLDFMEGNVDGALMNLKLAEGASNPSAEVLDLIGQLYLRLRRVTEGTHFLERSIALKPMRASAHAGRAVAYLLDHDPIGAERESCEAVRLNPRARGAQYYLGLALQRQDRIEEAIAAYKSAAALDSCSAGSAYRRLADLFERRGEQALAFHHRSLAQQCRTDRLPGLDVEWSRQGLADDSPVEVYQLKLK